MRQMVVTVGALATADADGISASQTPNAGPLLINGALASGGVATLDKPRRVLITAAGNESDKTFTITGTSANFTGTISETITGPNATTAQSVLDYSTVTRITISANAAGALTVGTNGVASSKPLPFDLYGPPTVALQCDATGTVSYTVSQSLDSPFTVAPQDVTWIDHPDTNLVAATGDVQSNYAYLPSQARITINSGTGSVKFTVNQ